MSHRTKLWHRILLWVALAPLVASTPALGAGPGPAIPPQAPLLAGSAIPCSNTPFGGTITLGHENEIFLGYPDTLQVAGQIQLGSYRFDSAPGQPILDQQLVLNSDNGRQLSSDLASATADLNGDGRSEHIQALRDATGRNQLLVHRSGTTPIEYLDGESNQSLRALAGGNILGGAGEAEQVVMASRTSSGALSVQVFGGDASAAITGRPALWRSTSNSRLSAKSIRVAVGNLDNDAYADIVIAILQSDGKTAQLIYLEYQPSFQSGSGDNLSQSLQLRSFATYILPQGVHQIQLALADANGDSADEIILGSEAQGGAQIWLSLFAPNQQTATLDLKANKDFATSSNGFTMATGDLDGIGPANGVASGSPQEQIARSVRQEEIILAYDSNGANGYSSGLHAQVIRLLIPQPGSGTPTPPSFVSDSYWATPTHATNLALAAADLNRDNRAEVIAFFSDGAQFGIRMNVYSYDTSVSFNRFVNTQSTRFDPTLTAPPTVAVGDWDGDSLRAKAQGQCAEITENQLAGAVFLPPFWQQIQVGVDKSASIGASRTNQQDIAKSYTTTNSHSSSVYIGTGIGFSFFDLIELGASVRTTASREYSTSSLSGTTVTAAQTTTTGREFSDNGVVYRPATYRCYSYQLYDGATPIAANEAGARLCEYIPQVGQVALAGNNQDSWDTINRSKPEWSPVVRDWSSLALFRGPNTAQSSTVQAASRAVDSVIAQGSFVGGTIAETQSEANAWWQVDLGASQDISKIRIYTPASSLKNFVVLVADSDFRQMSGSGDAGNLIGQPGVRSYTLADLGLGMGADSAANSVTTFLTLNGAAPIRGRFVRIQRRDTGSLKLAEVQVFGPTHVEPDRYPLNVRDTNSSDGFFEVQLFNQYATQAEQRYPWVQVRGRLLWGGEARGTRLTIPVNRGGSTGSWSRSSVTGASSYTGYSVESSSSIGSEFDVQAGLLVQVQGGGGSTTTTGIGEESTQTLGWSESFDIGGAIGNFPDTYDSQAWADKCSYTFQPYFYETTEESNIGYKHAFTTLDYLVPTDQLNRLIDLGDCRNGNQSGPAPAAVADQVVVRASQPLTIPVLANDIGNTLKITGVGPAQFGLLSFTDRSITYTPNAGYTGLDSFTYTITDLQGNTTTSSVSVSVLEQPFSISLPLVTR